jgi:hypothetical protein
MMFSCWMRASRINHHASYTLADGTSSRRLAPALASGGRVRICGGLALVQADTQGVVHRDASEIYSAVRSGEHERFCQIGIGRAWKRATLLIKRAVGLGVSEPTAFHSTSSTGARTSAGLHSKSSR